MPSYVPPTQTQAAGIAMKVTRSKSPAKSSRKRPAKEQAFDDAWNKVITQQQKNARLREEVQAFSREVSAAIEEHEKAYITAACQTCEHLLSFCNRKSLGKWQREDLQQWILGYVINISSNPFSSPADLSALNAAVAAQLHEMPDPASSGHAESSEGRSHSPQTDDMFADLFDDAEAEDGCDEGFDEALDAFAEALFGEFSDPEHAREACQAEEQGLNNMMRASSINKLFRKVARVLHPDRERDESARVEKNRLMGELLQARDNNDIPLIFSLYAEHVGESPLQELADDLDGVTQLLQRQFENLRDQKDEIIEEEPFAAALYRRFHQRSRPAVNREIHKHVLQLKRDTLELQSLRKEVNTVSKLKRHLASLKPEFDLDTIFNFYR